MPYTLENCQEFGGTLDEQFPQLCPTLRKEQDIEGVKKALSE